MTWDDFISLVQSVKYKNALSIFYEKSIFRTLLSLQNITPHIKNARGKAMTVPRDRANARDFQTKRNLDAFAPMKI